MKTTFSSSELIWLSADVSVLSALEAGWSSGGLWWFALVFEHELASGFQEGQKTSDHNILIILSFFGGWRILRHHFGLVFRMPLVS